MSMHYADPPRLAAWLLDLFVDQHEAEAVTGDLSEEFPAVAARFGAGSARRWYWRQVISAIAQLAWNEVRLAPWSTAAIVVAGLSLLTAANFGIEAAAHAIVSRSEVYEHVGAVWFWRVFDFVRFVVRPVAIGWTIARAARGKEILVASLVSATLVLFCLWDLSVLAVYTAHSAQQIPISVVTDVVHLGVTIPLSILAGGVIRRKTAVREM